MAPPMMFKPAWVPTWARHMVNTKSCSPAVRTSRVRCRVRGNTSREYPSSNFAQKRNAPRDGTMKVLFNWSQRPPYDYPSANADCICQCNWCTVRLVALASGFDDWRSWWFCGIDMASAVATARIISTLETTVRGEVASKDLEALRTVTPAMTLWEALPSTDESCGADWDTIVLSVYQSIFRERRGFFNRIFGFIISEMH